MAIQDTFVGNLRKSKDKSGTSSRGGFIDELRNSLNERALQQKRARTPGSVGYKGELGPARPSMSEPRTVDQDISAQRGSLFVKAPDIAKNSQFNAMHITSMPKTEKDWQNFSGGLDDFDAMMNAYAKEPNQDKRIKLIEQSTPKVRKSEKLSRYLYVLRENELANKRGELADFNYKDQPKYLKQAIDDLLSLHYKRA